MRHAGVYFAEEILRLQNQGENWDILFCTDMLNVAELKGLLPTTARAIPIVLYFHENQFTYPNRKNQVRDLHFPFSNFVSALAADRNWFNSRFNLESMLEGIKVQAKTWPDYVPTKSIRTLAAKSEIQPPGIATASIDLEAAANYRNQQQRNGEPIHLVWAARWEHDKNADDLLEALIQLDQRDVDFRISVIGQSYSKIPDAFAQIQDRFQNRIVCWGFQESRESYWKLLAEADVFVSTAMHEFFGISAAEAIAAGLFPILPKRLAYPELIDSLNPTQAGQQYLFDGSATDLANRVASLVRERNQGYWKTETTLARSLIEKLNWLTRAREMDESLTELVRQISR